MAREFPRHLRVGTELQRVLNELLHTAVKDPRLKDVRASEVEVSGDLGVARVFFSSLTPDADPAPIIAALVRATPFLRTRVGRELKLRRVPELRFEQDLSAQQGFRIARLLQGAESESESESESDNTPPAGD